MAGMVFDARRHQRLTLLEHLEFFPIIRPVVLAAPAPPATEFHVGVRVTLLPPGHRKGNGAIHPITRRLLPRPAEIDPIVLFKTTVRSGGIPSPLFSLSFQRQLLPLLKSVDAGMIHTGGILGMNHSTARAAKHILLSITERGGYPDFKPLYRQAGYEVESAGSVRKALSLLKKTQPDVIVAEFNYQSDFRDRTSSLESLLAAVQRSPKTKMIVFYENEHAHQLAKLQMRLPVYEAFAYPIDAKKLAESLRRAAAG